jgi:hypothetical protein
VSNEALAQHLLEQQEAAERDWHALSRTALSWAKWNAIACCLGGGLDVTHYWLRMYDWPWLIVQLVGSSMQVAALVSMLCSRKRSRIADAAYDVLMDLMNKRMRLALDDLDTVLAKQRRGY